MSVEYARGLRARGHDVSVFAQSIKREHADEGIAFKRVAGFSAQVALRAVSFPIVATRAVESARLDNVVAFGSSVTMPAVFRIPGAHRSWWEVANREWPATTVDGLRRRANPHHRVVLAWDQRVIGGGVPKAVLAAGEWAAADIRRFYPAVRDRVEVLPDGVNLDEFSFDSSGRAKVRADWGLADGDVALFTVATELRRKGLGTMFEAFRLVREVAPGTRLFVAGRVPAADVRALAVQHRVVDGVRAVGFVEDLRAAYSAADVLVFPTRFDPWGLPIVEALACGTPVAASQRAGAASAVRPESSGALIADPADPAVVAGGILRAMQIEPDRSAIRASVAAFAWDRVIDGLEDVLERTR